MKKNSIPSAKKPTAKSPAARKVLKGSTEREKPAKMVFVEEYLNMLDFERKPVTLYTLELLAKDLVDWALNDPQALKVSPFFKQRGIGTTTIDRWRKRSPEFDEAYVYAKELIGDRREIGGLQNEYDGGMITKSMPLYDNEWKGMEEWRSKLKDQSENQGNIKVVIEQCPPSDKVPDKREE